MYKWTLTPGNIIGVWSRDDMVKYDTVKKTLGGGLAGPEYDRWFVTLDGQIPSSATAYKTEAGAKCAATHRQRGDLNVLR